MKKSISFISPISSRSGYGDCSREIALAMLQLFKKENIELLSTRWGNCPLSELDYNTETNNYLKSKLVSTPNKNCDVSCQVSLPSEFYRFGKRSYGITAGLEFLGWPDDFILKCNEMDSIIVHSEFTKQALLDSEHNNVKCETPVNVVFQSYDEIYSSEIKENTKNSRMENLLSNIQEEFCFLAVGVFTENNDRKNIVNLIETFQKTFANTKHQVALVLKINGPRYNTQNLCKLRDFIKSLNMKFENPQSTYLLYGDFQNTDLKIMYTHPKIKSLVTLTHGEGFGRPLLEASVCGLPIIASNWSGHIDFLDSEMAHLVQGKLEYVGDIIPYSTNKSVWFSPDYSHASSLLVNLVENYKECKTNAIELGKINAKKYNKKEMYNVYESIIQ